MEIEAHLVTLPVGSQDRAKLCGLCSGEEPLAVFPLKDANCSWGGGPELSALIELGLQEASKTRIEREARWGQSYQVGASLQETQEAKMRVPITQGLPGSGYQKQAGKLKQNGPDQGPLVILPSTGELDTGMSPFVHQVQIR